MKNHHFCNVSTLERSISILGGAFLLYQSLKKRNRTLAVVPAAMLLSRGVSGYCPAYDLMGKKEIKSHNVNIQVTLQVEKPVAEIYSFWRKLENLPLFMKHLKKVEEIDRKHSKWTAKFPGGLGSFSWKAEIVNEKKNEVIGWNSVENSTIDNAGKVEFYELGPALTQLHIVISYQPGKTPLAESLARAFSPAFEKMVRDDVENFKEIMEAKLSSTYTNDFRNELI